MKKKFDQTIESWAALTSDEIIKIIQHKYKSGAIDNESFAENITQLAWIYYLAALKELFNNKSYHVVDKSYLKNLEHF